MITSQLTRDSKRPSAGNIEIDGIRFQQWRERTIHRFVFRVCICSRTTLFSTETRSRIITMVSRDSPARGHQFSMSIQLANSTKSSFYHIRGIIELRLSHVDIYLIIFIYIFLHFLCKNNNNKKYINYIYIYIYKNTVAS